MKILITGGCGFIGSFVAERFAKEGGTVYIIDNLSSGTESTIKSGYKFYNLDVTDKHCEEIFRINNFDIVIHLAAARQEEKSAACCEARLGSQTDVLGLINMLELSQKYRVKKFIFTSSAAVYGNKAELPIKEEANLAPVSVYGVNKAVGEYYCRKWRELYGLDTVVLRLASVYGPSYTFHNQTGDIPCLLRKMVEKEDIIICGNESQTRDYIYVDEVAYIIYQMTVKNVSANIFNISSNIEVSLKELLERLSLLGDIKSVRYEKKSPDDIERLALDNTLLKEQLKWVPKYEMGTGLKNTYEWYLKNYVKPVSAKKESSFRNFLEIIHPYIENIGIFSLLWFLNFEGYASFINQKIGIDYNYIYIAVMGFLYGKKQSIIATILSGALFTANFLEHGGDWVALIYQEQYLFHLATYLCVGVVTGFAIDNKDRIIKDITSEVENLKERHGFLEKVHLEANQIKDDLYGQIVNTDDSIGKVYSIVRKLETLEMEKIYTTAAEIVCTTMKAQFVALYTVNKYETYLRLNTRVGENAECPNSLKIDDYPHLKNIMTSKRVFINKNMDENCPDMAAPILYQGKVFAIVQIYNLPFGHFTLFYENLFRIMTMFISDALIKAYLYSEGIKEKRYLKNTNILIASEFEKIFLEIEHRKDISNQDVVLLKITQKPDDYEKLYEKMANVFRAEDYIGLKGDGHVYVLLINVEQSNIVKIQDRLKSVGVIAEIES